MIDYRDTIIAQYANAPVLTAILEYFNTTIDTREFWKTFISSLWDIETAQGYGLDIWGEIVGVKRVVSNRNATWFGFQEETTGLARPFDQTSGQGVFWDGFTALFRQVALDDESYRKLIMAKAAANISDGSILSINRILSTLFHDRGTVYIKDNRDMSLKVVTSWAAGQEDIAQLGIILSVLRPAGVQVVFAAQAS